MLSNMLSHIKDYGFLDVVYSKVNRKEKDQQIGDGSYEKHSRLDISDEIWICFLPWRVRFQKAQRFGMLPRKSDFVVYEIPTSIVNPNPNMSKKSLIEIVRDFEICHANSRACNVLGYSVGNYPAVFIANYFPVNRLVLVAPGSRLGACLWEGIATQEVRRRAESLGIKTAEDYDEAIKGTNPIENVGNLPSSIEMHLATHDKYIPTRFGEELRLAIEGKGKRPCVYRYNGKGHILTLRQFGLTHSL